MAIIPLYYVTAASYDLDSTFSGSIAEGQCVFMNGALGVRAVDATANAIHQVLGLAGDTKSTAASSMPGVQSGWQNRVSDGYDETKASGKITVYHSGGEFATDQFLDDGSLAAAGGQFLKCNTSGLLIIDGATKSFDTVAQLITVPGQFPSGVPGTEVNGDAALASAQNTTTNDYITVKLLV